MAMCWLTQQQPSPQIPDSINAKSRVRTTQQLSMPSGNCNSCMASTLFLTKMSRAELAQSYRDQETAHFYIQSLSTLDVNSRGRRGLFSYTRAVGPSFIIPTSGDVFYLTPTQGLSLAQRNACHETAIIKSLPIQI